MTLVQHSPANNWFEPASGDATLPLRALLTDNGTDFSLATEGEQDAAFVDVDGQGVYDLLNLSDRLYCVTDGAGGITLATSGTPIVQLNDNGAGGYELSSDLTQPEAAVFYASQDGSYCLALPNGGNGIQMIAVGSDITLFI